MKLFFFPIQLPIDSTLNSDDEDHGNNHPGTNKTTPATSRASSVVNETIVIGDSDDESNTAPKKTKEQLKQEIRKSNSISSLQKLTFTLVDQFTKKTAKIYALWHPNPEIIFAEDGKPKFAAFKCAKCGIKKNQGLSGADKGSTGM